MIMQVEVTNGILVFGMKYQNQFLVQNQDYSELAVYQEHLYFGKCEKPF